MPTSVRPSIPITIRFLGIFLGIMCIFFALSFVSLAIPVAFQKQDGSANLWLIAVGLSASAVFVVGAGYAAKKMFFSPVPDLAKHLPTGLAISAYLISTVFLFGLLPRELTREHAALDFSKVAAPWILAWIIYRLSKSYTDRYYASIMRGKLRGVSFDCPRCGFFVVNSAAACPNCHESARSPENQNG